MNYNIIVSGHFSKNGNFIGVNHKKEKIHIYKNQMDSLNLRLIEDIKFPIFAFGNVKIFDRLTGEFGDENREIITHNHEVKETFNRLTASVVHKDFDSFINAFAEPIILNLDIIEHRRSIIENAGLTDKIKSSTSSELNTIKENYLEAEKVFKEYFECKISIGRI